MRIDRSLGPLAYLGAIWKRRDFALTLPLSQLKAAHMDTFLGGTWHVLNPLFLAGIYYLIFGVILGARAGVDNYVGYLIVGMFTFWYTQKCFVGGARIVVANIQLIRAIHFPRAILPMGAVIAEGLAQLPVLLVMAVLVVITGEDMSLYWLLVIPLFLVQSLFNLGLALIVSRFTVYFRDFGQILPYVSRLWLYLSGILYTIDRVPEGWARTLFKLNPIYPFINLARLALLDGTTDGRLWVEAVAWAIAIACAGFVFFRAKEREYALAH